MMKMLKLRLAIAMCGTLAGPALSAAGELPAQARQVSLQKDEAGHYAWQLRQVPMPQVGPHQVLVHVRAVALQRGELELIAQLNNPDRKGPDRVGLIVCADAAGDVVAIGAQVKDLRVGAQVTSLYFANYLDGRLSAAQEAQGHGYQVNGVLGDYVLLEDTGIAPMPRGLSYQEASTLPTIALTAWMATVGGHNVQRGSVVLVQGTGGISTFALQFAAAEGARVIVTSSSDEKLQRAHVLGARDGINYQATPDWDRRVLELTGGQGADLVVDVGGQATLSTSVRSLAYGGTLAVVGGLSGYGGSVSISEIIEKVARAQGVYVGSRADYLRMCAYIAKHRIHPVIERTYPMDKYPDALRDLGSGNFIGKLVLLP